MAQSNEAEVAASIVEGPDKYGVLLTSLLEGKDVWFSLVWGPPEEHRRRKIRARVELVQRGHPQSGLCDEWFLRCWAIEGSTQYIFEANYSTHGRSGTAIFPKYSADAILTITC
ncbi:MAG: hypothetical protein AAB691_00935 [Patescibacteria group bacterium]